MKRISVFVVASFMILGQVNAQTKPRVITEKIKIEKEKDTAEQYTFPLSDKVTRQEVTFKNR